jgi:hypothetical protein
VRLNKGAEGVRVPSRGPLDQVVLIHAYRVPACFPV